MLAVQYMLQNRFWCKVVKTKFDVLVAICDEEVVGKEIEIENGFKIVANERFYKEKLINESEALELMQKATIGNLLGERIIRLAVEKGVISPESIILIGGVPHAQFVKI